MEKTELTPKQIVAELNKYIVGQSEAKKSVSIALRNRWRRKRLSEDMQDELLDRFGDLPKAVQNLLVVACLKIRAHNVYVKEIVEKPDEIRLALYEKAKLNPAAFPEFLARFQRALGLGNVSPLLIQVSHLLFILSYMRKLRFSYFLTVFMPVEAFSSILESNANVLAFFSFAPANASSISLFVSCLKLMPVGSNK